MDTRLKNMKVGLFADGKPSDTYNILFFLATEFI